MKLDGSSRQPVALLVASASGPYLTSLFLNLNLPARRGFSDASEAFEFVVAILVLGTAGLVIYGVPIALAAAALAVLFTWRRFHHWSVAITSGAALGATFYLVLDASAPLPHGLGSTFVS